jgi:hypothetical protein
MSFLLKMGKVKEEGIYKSVEAFSFPQILQAPLDCYSRYQTSEAS